MTFPSRQKIENACQIVYEAMAPTAQYCWPLLSERAGCEVWLKHENHGPLGAFKIRSGLVYLRRLRESGSTARVAVTATRGNFGQAVDRKSTRLNSSHRCISYAVFCLK